MEIGKYIDHTNLKMDAKEEDIVKLCEEAIKYGFENVCVNPCYVKLAKGILKDTNIGVCTVVGFPVGMNTPKVKSFEAIDAIENGADEIDMVINVGALKDKDYDYVKKEIELIRDDIDGKVLKVIIETSLLTKEEIKKMTEICNETFVHFIKTNTGFGKRGVSEEDIDIINKYKNDLLKIKASGNIKDFKFMNKLISKGVSRIGTSSSVDIIKNMEEIK
ncbi:MAG: deoxyribose-phosphate aldolase [Bacilli bacterium]|nr:deoxyribose-phosphate aldolase [Bacilli bacterium]